jgi:hypothetical protein
LLEQKKPQLVSPSREPAFVAGDPHEPATAECRTSQPFTVLPSQFEYPSEQLPRVQVPLPQDALAPGKLQVRPHMPQFAVVLSWRSHPLPSRPSQLPQSGLHIVSVQLPLAHDVLPFGRLQVVPQVPQLESVFSGVSQPFAAASSQSPQPPEHPVTRHVPVEQSPTPRDGAHEVPHAPQFALVVREVSQPFVSTKSQSPQSGLHDIRAQLPEPQVAVA